MQTASLATDTSYRSNALQNRISQVLAASFADIDIRDALAILDDRGIQNTADIRRDLQLDIQQELIECNAEIVHDFGEVADQLKRIGAAIQSLQESCAEIRKHVTSANRESGPMIEEAKTISAERETVGMKRDLLGAFQQHFVISESDEAYLTSSGEQIDNNFFQVLDRVKQIHHDSQLLLGTEDQRLGLEILDHSSRLLNTAYQKLYRGIQQEFKSPNLEDPKTSTTIRRSLRVLSERPALFQNCIDLFASACAETLSSSFQSALTGMTNGTGRLTSGKAIELSAHDPLRYTSDMLAWVHSTTVSERESLELLFTSQKDEIAVNMRAGAGNASWLDANDIGGQAVFDPSKTLNELIDRDLGGVFQLLKQRVEQVLQSHDDAILAYKISNLVLFYSSIFSPLMPADAGCLSTLQPLADMGMRSFTSAMRDRISGLQTELAHSPDDLQPPEFLIDALSNLQALMKSYDTSILEPDTTKRAAGFQPVVEEALLPYLTGCETIAHRLRAPRDKIFILNCTLTTLEALRKYTFAGASLDLQTKISTSEEGLTNDTHQWFLVEAGLQSLLQTTASSDDLRVYYKNSKPLSLAAEKLDTFLPTANEDALAFLGELIDRAIARRIIAEAVELFCADVDKLQMMLEQADELRQNQINGDARDEVLLQEIFHRTTEEIRVLLR